MSERCKDCGALIDLVGIRHRCVPRAPAKDVAPTARKKPRSSLPKSNKAARNGKRTET